MNLFALLIRRPAGASLLAIGLLIAGVWAYRQLGVAALPSLDLPAVVVLSEMPGANADTMANTVMAPLERHLGRIPGIRQMTGIANEGRIQIQILFDFGVNTDAAARDVQSAINAASVDLPPGMPSPPRYAKFDTASLPILLVTLTSKTLPPERLHDLADSLAKPAIARVDGVAGVTLSGGSPHAVRVELDTLALSAKGITANDVGNALRAANVTMALGAIGTQQAQMSLVTTDGLRTALDVSRVLVSTRNGVPVRLGDIAVVTDGGEDIYQGAWYNGERSVVMEISKRPEANAVATAEAVAEALPGVRGLLPADIEVRSIFDLTQTTKTALHEVELTLCISVIMVALVMMLFLRRIGPTLIAMASVPLSLAGAFIAMWWLGFSLNTLSLVALVLAIGFVVDDAIVVIENIVRHRELGLPATEAALIGTREIGFTVVSITLSLLAVFAPMVFGNNLFVSLVHEFSVTLTAAIVVSAVVSLTLTPALCGRYLPHGEPNGTNRIVVFLEHLDAIALGHYERALAWAMRHRRLMRWQPVLLLGVTGALMVAVAVTAGAGVMPDEDLGMFQAIVRVDANTSPGRLAQRTRDVAATILADPSVADVTAVLGGNDASLFVDLKTASERRTPIKDVMDRLSKTFDVFPDVTVAMSPIQFFGGSGDTRSGGGQYQLELTSSTGFGMQSTTLQFAERMRSLPQLRDVTTSFDGVGKQQAVTVDRDAAARLGVGMAQVDDALYDAFGQRPVSTIYSDTYPYRVVLSASGAESLSPAGLLGIHVRSVRGALVPLSSLATLRPTMTPTEVRHHNQLEAASIAYNLAPGISQVEGIRVVDALVENGRLPPGVQGDYAGSNQKLIDAAVGAVIMLVAVIVLMYVLLGILYENLVHPLTILSTLPAAGVGAFLAMFITQTPVTLMSVIAILMLIGIVKKNAIMLVDFALAAERERGLTPVEAILEAARVRFRPITMTTLAAIGAALPLAIGFGVGSEMRRPLGIAMVGGLVVSQLLTLLSTPAIYLWAHDRRVAWLGRVGAISSNMSLLPKVRRQRADR